MGHPIDLLPTELNKVGTVHWRNLEQRFSDFFPQPCGCMKLLSLQRVVNSDLFSMEYCLSFAQAKFALYTTLFEHFQFKMQEHFKIVHQSPEL